MVRTYIAEIQQQLYGRYRTQYPIYLAVETTHGSWLLHSSVRIIRPGGFEAKEADDLMYVHTGMYVRMCSKATAKTPASRRPEIQGSTRMVHGVGARCRAACPWKQGMKHCGSIRSIVHRLFSILAPARRVPCATAEEEEEE